MLAARLLVRPPLSAKLYSCKVLCDEELDSDPNEESDSQNNACWLGGHCLQQNCTCLSVSTSDYSSQDRYYCL
jgi:hypothetical protein